MIYSISATMYNTFSMCPLQYKYKYEYGLLSTKGDALIVGSLYHKMLELYHISGLETAKEVMDNSGDHKGVLEHLFNKYLGSPISGNVIETEYEFNIKLNGVKLPLYGFIDRIDDDKGVEYKTTSKKWKDEDVDNIQTDIYMYALLKKFGRAIPLVYSINNKKTNMPPQRIDVCKTSDEIIKLEDKIKNFVKDVKKSRFNPTPGGHCFMCPWGKKGDSTCPYG